jgi:hypothetical protein
MAATREKGIFGPAIWGENPTALRQGDAAPVQQSPAKASVKAKQASGADVHPGRIPSFRGTIPVSADRRRGPAEWGFRRAPAPRCPHHHTSSPTTFVQPTTHHPPPGRMVSRGPACLPPRQKADPGEGVRHHRDEAPTRGAHIRVILRFHHATETRREDLGQLG